MRTGPRWAKYLAYRKVMQEAVSPQLALWGDAVETPAESLRRHTRPIERDLESVLVDLARRFPAAGFASGSPARGAEAVPLGRAEVSVADPPARASDDTPATAPEESAEPESEDRAPGGLPASNMPEPGIAPVPLPGGHGPRRLPATG